MLATRVLTAVVLIPVVVLPLWRGGFLFVLLVAIAAALALREFYGLMRAGGVQPATLLGSLGLALMLIGAGVPDQRVQNAAVVVLVLGGLLWALADPTPEGKLAGWALTAAGAFYVGWPLAHAVELRALPNGFGWLVVTLVATWATDTGAYFAGRFFGRHPFSPRYSPKKTWEGVAGGWLLGLLVTVALAYWLLDLPLGRG
ncbi:MAG TPA: phosphatidate cytidylyltransferase, partial [Ardenticatenaceae bacterium]|nr:phosphatidate cytidylyltransferase [Ardenticatenaceae bacterium]